MRLKTVKRLVSWLLFFQVIVFVTGIQAQDKRVVTIKSDPPGVMLYFKGENSFVGVTPFTVKPNLMGNYKITAVKQGYEKSKVQYYFKGTESGTLRLRLSPKTRFKAAMRSMVFPGWGQIYSDRKHSGIFLSLVQAGAGLFTLVAHNDYNNAYDKYKNALSDYEENKKFSALRDDYWDVVVARHKEASNAFDKRQTWLYISGGLWIYNFLDSILFFPSFDNEIFNRSLPGISVNFQNDTVGLNLSFQF